MAEMTREKIFIRLHDELPYELEVETVDWKRIHNTYVVHQEVYVARESQKGIVLGKNGRVIKEISIKARYEIEKFLGQKVHLFLKAKLGVIKATYRSNYRPLKSERVLFQRDYRQILGLWLISNIYGWKVYPII